MPPPHLPQSPQVFVGSALEGDDSGVTAIKAWAVDKLPDGPTLYPKVRPCACMYCTCVLQTALYCLKYCHLSMRL